MNHSAVKRLFIALAILFSGQCLRATENSFTTSAGHVIEFKKFDRNYFATLQYLRHLDTTVGRIVKDSPGHSKIEKCRFFISPDNQGGIKIARIDGLLCVSLNSDSDGWKNDFETNRKLLGLLILSRVGIAQERYNEVIPPWILTGFIGLCRQKEYAAKIVDLNYLPGLRACAVAGNFPNLRTVLRYPMKPDANGAAYEFYEEVCRFLLREANELSVGSENVVRDIIMLSAKKKYSETEIFNTTIGRLILEKYSRSFPSKMEDEQKIQAWFEYTVKSRVVSAYNPYTAEQYQKKLTEIKTVKAKMKNGATETFPVEQLPIKFDEIEGKNTMVMEKQQQMEQLVMSGPPLLFDEATELHRAIATIGNIRPERASRQISETLAALDKKLEKQFAIERFLNETAEAQTSASLLYGREMSEVTRGIYEPWPNLTKYLAAQQRKFLE